MSSSLVQRGARLVAVGILIGWSSTQIGFRVADWSLSDMDAYWSAAMRLRAGEPIYPQLADPSAPDVFRYAPWFAAVWVPLTFLPESAVAVAWSAVLLFGAAWAIAPLLAADLGRVASATFFASFLIWGASVGNVQPLMVAVLLHTIDRRTGPVWIGVAASLKAVPIVFLLLYIGRRQWRRTGVGLLVFALLASTILLVDVTHYPFGPGDAPSPLYATSPVLVAIVVGLLAVMTTLAARRASDVDRLTAAMTALAALPRITLLDLPLVLIGVRPKPSREAGRDA